MTRLDFVSNSSSSSFIVNFLKRKNDFEKFLWILRNVDSVDLKSTNECYSEELYKKLVECSYIKYPSETTKKYVNLVPKNYIQNPNVELIRQLVDESDMESVDITFADNFGYDAALCGTLYNLFKIYKFDVKEGCECEICDIEPFINVLNEKGITLNT